MEKRKPEEYAFLCSVVRSNEKKLMSKADLNRAVDAKTVQQVMNVISEFGYGDGKELSNPRDFEGILRDNLDQAYDDIISALPDKDTFDFMLLSADYHNLKVLLKSEFMGTEHDDLLIEGGTIPKEKLKEMLRERNFAFMSYEMKKGIKDVLETFPKEKDPQTIDIILDRACLNDQCLRAKELGNDFIMGYMRRYIDISNIKTFIRLREMGKPWSFYQKVFIEGGFVSEKALVTSWEEPYNQVADKLAPFGFRELFSAGASNMLTEGKFIRSEKIAENILMKYVKDAKYRSFGIEPAFGYLIAKETENTNLRVIFTGKIANVPDSVTLERLMDTYV